MTAAASRPASIVVVRHGETDWNIGRVIQGRTEVPLNARGLAQAAEAAELLRDLGAWSGVITSPLGRAVRTGGIIAEALGLAAGGVDPELLERDFGAAEGLRVDVAHARWPGLEVPGAETPAALAERGSRALARILREAPGSIVVAHGALMRSALTALGGTEAPRILNGEAWRLSAEAPGSPLGISRIGAPAEQHAV
ncbi:histidine phosphatase family protein [Leucobacter allii]|uniref:Histidine phosphatase family protein n=1 Tax=Leucobacter allii TaxID=2932247 RepID=A0ABY4FJH5_9MICO|nr:histidine phosphatase family protein [Leucobacter allii]UOQ56266.1 histidine phosphatase family protein [Leucobacter allii]